MSGDSSRLPVASSVRASLNNSSMYVFPEATGKSGRLGHLKSIVTVSVCFVHLKTGVGRNTAMKIEISYW